MRRKTHQLVLTALFVALVLLLGLTPLGMIPLGFTNATTLCIPVIVGTLMLGLKTGMALGFCFGTVSMLGAFGIAGPLSALAATLAAESPALTLTVCYVPRLIIPVVVYAAHSLLERKHGSVALAGAAIAGSVCNTILYLGMMLVFYMIKGLDYSGLLLAMSGTGLIQGGCEAVIAAVLTPPVVNALRKIQR